jgi:protein PET100, fungi type
MGGPNLEIFKFALYIFTPVMTMRMFPLLPSHSTSKILHPLPAPPIPNSQFPTPSYPLPLPFRLLPSPPIPTPPAPDRNPPKTVYFGTNLDRRFAVPDFWPRPEETHRIPFEREEIVAEMERLKRKRLRLREQRLRNEQAEGGAEGQGSEGTGPGS